jgi:hypothetical protein
VVKNGAIGNVIGKRPQQNRVTIPLLVVARQVR